MEQVLNSQATTSVSGQTAKLDKAGWGIALIWIGAAILLNLGWGTGLFGLGVIVLGSQLVRRFMGLASDGFAIFFGLCLVLASIGPVFGVRSDNLLPILSIGLGAVILGSVLFRSRSA